MMKNALCVLLILPLVGCANFGKDLKSFLGGKSNSSQAQKASPRGPQEKLIKYSDVQNVGNDDPREYRRITRQDFESRELQTDRAGSLWVMEGQDSYLFSENNMRLAGDLINIELDGQPEKQLATKAKIITDLMKRIEMKRRAPARSQKAKAQTEAEPATEAEKAPEATSEESVASAGSGEAPTESSDFDVKQIPSRIIEKLSDGSYRVKGSQSFLIGSTEYRVIATGLVKPSDIANNSVESSKVLDSRFDIVRSTKR